MGTTRTIFKREKSMNTVLKVLVALVLIEWIIILSNDVVYSVEDHYFNFGPLQDYDQEYYRPFNKNME